jgi:signal transduction histidine kinase
MPSIFSQTIDLLTKSGALVYYLIILFALEAIVGMTLGRARRNGWTPILRRSMIAASVLLLGRVVLMIVALLGQLGVPPGISVATAIMPPLERYIDLVSLGFLAWAMVPLLLDRAQLGLGIVLGNLVLSTVAYAYFGIQWYNASTTPDLFYNNTSTEVVWQVWSLALALLAALGSLVGRDEQSGLATSVFGLLAIGHALQLIAPPPASHIAGWVWLAQLAAYPLWAIAIYRRVNFGESVESPHISIDQSSNVAPVLEAAQHIASRQDPQLSLLQATAALATALQADIAAIGLPSARPGSVELAAIHSPGASPTPGASFVLDDQPAIKRSITRRRPIVIGAERDDNPIDTSSLYELMGSHVSGPLLAVPLINDRSVLGLALFGNPSSGRAWTAADAQRARSLCDYLATALATAKQHELQERRIEELSRTWRQQTIEAAQRTNSLEGALQKVQGEAAQAINQAQQQQKRINELAALVEMHEEQTRLLDSTQGDGQITLDQLTRERAQLQAEVQEHTQENEHLTQLQSILESELKGMRQRMVELQTALAQRPAVSDAERDKTTESDESQPEVIASLAQELRTPMTSINGYADLLLGESVGILGAMQRQFLQRVKANIERMDGMLQDLIGITAIETGQIKIEPELIEVSEVIEEAVMNAASTFRDRELSIRIEVAEGLSRLQADRDSLYQIILHLLSNAALCSPNNSEVIVRAQEQTEMPDYLVFSVADRGGGIALEDRQRAFHRMYRADNPLIQGLGETGVGLSIAKALVEAQGGRIWVDSVMGEGSTFTFVLPINSQPHQVETPV